MSVCPEELKLVALDRDDIEVVSAHVQDALVRVGDMLWLPREHRFVMALNRFDWMTVVDAKHAAEYRRCRTALRFERVLGCKCRGLDQSDKEARLNLLAVEFAERDAPAGDRNADLLRRRRHSSRGRMPGGRARRSRRSHHGGHLPRSLCRRIGNGLSRHSAAATCGRCVAGDANSFISTTITASVAA